MLICMPYKHVKFGFLDQHTKNLSGSHPQTFWITYPINKTKSLHDQNSLAKNRLLDQHVTILKYSIIIIIQ